MSEATVTLTTIEPVLTTKKRGRPAGRRKAVPLPLNTEASLAKATYVITVSADHYRLIDSMGVCAGESKQAIMAKMINSYIKAVVQA